LSSRLSETKDLKRVACSETIGDRYAQLLRNKVNSIINIAGLAIGHYLRSFFIALYVQDEIRYDRDFKDPNAFTSEPGRQFRRSALTDLHPAAGRLASD